MLRRYVGFLLHCIRQGPKALKEFAHVCRERALTRSGVPEKVVKKLFLASTVTRAVYWKVQPQQLDLKIQEAKERWLEKRIVDQTTAKSIERYMDLLPLTRLAGVEIEDPLPSGNACLSHPRRKGGTAAALLEREIDRSLMRASEIEQFNQMTYLEAAGGDLPAAEIEDMLMPSTTA